ncbi:Hypothetical protein BQ3484_229 [Cedratvirus A11]|uniref:Uncharacterized protein n=1 Tax=Cedratvirus A11 TaxID=1903266 RepID=A0A1M7XUH3_9VIRU|nr:Hypothetical protein BQ3484_229 [Cedratvirus A11]SHO33297.1 Hypothetical protein BQ3484_229 [Cedratvirus A11]
MHSLQNIILSNLPYQQLYNICADRENRVRGALECDNLADETNIWKNKALVEFDVPFAFFDLALKNRSLLPSPSQRYVEVATYFTLQPFSQATLEDDGISLSIEGIYESTWALIEAVERKDDRMTEYFFSLLSPSQKIYVRNHLLDVKTSHLATRLIYGIETEKSYYQEEDDSLLITIIKTGNIALLNRQLELEGIIPSTFRIEEHIPDLGFDPKRTEFPLFYLPLYIKPLPANKLINAAIYSCNPRILDFFRSYFNVDRPNTGHNSLLQGYKRHRKPVQAYSILQRIQTRRDATFSILQMGNLDLALLHMSRVGSCDLDLFSYLPGNLPLFIALLPYCLKGEERPKAALTDLLNETPFSFPQTRQVIEYIIGLL